MRFAPRHGDVVSFDCVPYIKFVLVDIGMPEMTALVLDRSGPIGPADIQTHLGVARCAQQVVTTVVAIATTAELVDRLNSKVVLPISDMTLYNIPEPFQAQLDVAETVGYKARMLVLARLVRTVQECVDMSVDIPAH